MDSPFARWAFLLLALSAATASCASVQKAAAKDPMKCERDPECARKRGKYNDCTTQCNDSPGCMQRCEEMTGR